MAWRIHDNVVRGEIDNRERGIVRGELWLEGVESPVRLELQGNAAPDLAGCLLTFENPGKRISMRKDSRLAPTQQGTVGDLTASRKVRVPDLPAEEACSRKQQGLSVPEHIANCLYLEWFSDSDGRVVIESTDYSVTVSTPSWRLSTAEEQERQVQAAQAFHGFLQKLSDALEARKHSPPEDKKWDEFDYEKFLRECDARTDKYAELLDKYRDHPDRDEIVAREMGWEVHAEKDEFENTESALADSQTEAIPESDDESDEDTVLQSEEAEESEEASDLAPDPATEGVDWVRSKDGFVWHPLVMRAMDGSTALSSEYEKLHLAETEDEDLLNLLNEYQTTTAKLGGALDGLAYGRDLSDGAFIVACLKRALSHLHASQAALQRVATRKLLADKLISSLRTEFFGLREEIIRLMEEFRSQA